MAIHIVRYVEKINLEVLMPMYGQIGNQIIVQTAGQKWMEVTEMLKLFIRDNMSGKVHEYGTDQHDSLVLQDDGSLHYYNLQNGCGTMFPDKGYSFCKEDGSIPQWDTEWGCEPYIDIGGSYYGEA